MRDDETDEAEHARGTYGGCGKQRSKNEEDQTGARDVYAETARRLLAQLQRIQPAAAEQCSCKTDERVGENHFRMTPAAPGKASGHPIHRALHAIGVENHQRRHCPAEKSCDCDAREDHAHRMHAVFPGEDKDKRNGDHCSDERAERDEFRLGRQQDHDAHGGKPRTCRNADNAGIGERIFQDALENAAGQCEVDARQCARDDARQTDVPENAVVLRRAVSQKRRQQIVRSDLNCA